MIFYIVTKYVLLEIHFFIRFEPFPKQNAAIKIRVVDNSGRTTPTVPTPTNIASKLKKNAL